MVATLVLVAALSLSSYSLTLIYVVCSLTLLSILDILNYTEYLRTLGAGRPSACTSTS